jgi:hypothetical protein
MLVAIAMIRWVPFLVNLLFSVWIAWSFRRYSRPPFWAIACLLIFGIGSIRLLFIAGELCRVSTVFVTVLSALFCFILALALSCRRLLGTSHPKSWIVATMIVLPPAIWADFRFRIIGVDVLGWPVPASAVFKRQSFMSSNPPSSTLSGSVFNTYPEKFNSIVGHGITLNKGVVYFGFCQWVVFRGDLRVSAGAGEPNGFKGSVQILNPEWDQWPIRVRAPLVLGH